jgi:hypothetical protein
MLTLVGAPLAGARLGGRKARPYKKLCAIYGILNAIPNNYPEFLQNLPQKRGL